MKMKFYIIFILLILFPILNTFLNKIEKVNRNSNFKSKKQISNSPFHGFGKNFSKNNDKNSLKKNFIFLKKIKENKEQSAETFVKPEKENNSYFPNPKEYFKIKNEKNNLNKKDIFKNSSNIISILTLENSTNNSGISFKTKNSYDFGETSKNKSNPIEIKINEKLNLKKLKNIYENKNNYKFYRKSFENYSKFKKPEKYDEIIFGARGLKFFYVDNYKVKIKNQISWRRAKFVLIPYDTKIIFFYLIEPKIGFKGLSVWSKSGRFDSDDVKWKCFDNKKIEKAKIIRKNLLINKKIRSFNLPYSNLKKILEGSHSQKFKIFYGFPNNTNIIWARQMDESEEIKVDFNNKTKPIICYVDLNIKDN